MLKYTINRNKAKVDVKNLPSGNAIFGVTDGLRVYCSDHKFHVGDSIYFNREDGDATFHAYKQIKEIVDKDNFLIENFDNYELSVIGVEKDTLAYHFGTSDSAEYMKIYLNAPHVMIDNRSTIPDYDKYKDAGTYIREFVSPPTSEPSTGRRCVGDYVLFDEWLLYQADGVDGDGRYIVESDTDNLNVKGRNIHVIMPEEIIAQIETLIDEGGAGELDNDTWEIRENELIIHNCIIPIGNDGKDNRRMIICPMIEGIYDILHEKSQSLGFYAEDDRFIDVVGETEEGPMFILKRGVSIQVRNYNIQLSNLFEEDYNPSLLLEDAVKTHVKDIIANSINGIVDYEKQPFVPIANGKMAEMIQFNLHFRDRGEINNNPEWKTDDSKYWNAWKNPNMGYDERGGDMLSFLGFTDDDIHYRKKKVSKSFLRLLFYDGKKRATQNLLFTATIFFDDGELYGKYIDAINNGIVYGAGDTSVIGDVRSNIRAEFFCYDKYRNEESSEGYYLHLFPSLITRNNGKIYMKAEFNHAKYGYTIPMVIPREKGGHPQPNYVINDDGARYVDMDGLFNDMYTEITISRTDEGIYVWKPENNGVGIVDERKIIFNLFEPKIN